MKKPIVGPGRQYLVRDHLLHLHVHLPARLPERPWIGYDAMTLVRSGLLEVVVVLVEKSLLELPSTLLPTVPGVCLEKKAVEMRYSRAFACNICMEKRTHRQCGSMRDALITTMCRSWMQYCNNFVDDQNTLATCSPFVKPLKITSAHGLYHIHLSTPDVAEWFWIFVGLILLDLFTVFTIFHHFVPIFFDLASWTFGSNCFRFWYAAWHCVVKSFWIFSSTETAPAGRDAISSLKLSGSRRSWLSRGRCRRSGGFRCSGREESDDKDEDEDDEEFSSDALLISWTWRLTLHRRVFTWRLGLSRFLYHASTRCDAIFRYLLAMFSVNDFVDVIDHWSWSIHRILSWWIIMIMLTRNAHLSALRQSTMYGHLHKHKFNLRAREETGKTGNRPCWEAGPLKQKGWLHVLTRTKSFASSTRVKLETESTSCDLGLERINTLAIHINKANRDRQSTRARGRIPAASSARWTLASFDTCFCTCRALSKNLYMWTSTPSHHPQVFLLAASLEACRCHNGMRTRALFCHHWYFYINSARRARVWYKTVQGQVKHDRSPIISKQKSTRGEEQGATWALTPNKDHPSSISASMIPYPNLQASSFSIMVQPYPWSIGHVIPRCWEGNCETCRNYVFSSPPFTSIYCIWPPPFPPPATLPIDTSANCSTLVSSVSVHMAFS